MEAIIIKFKDSQGKPYNWYIDAKYLRTGDQEASLNAMARTVAGIEVLRTDDKNVYIQEYKLHRTNQVPRDSKKRNTSKIKKELAAVKEKNTPKPRISHWIFTPNDVLRLKTETLINRLLQYAADDGDIDIFLSHLRMMKAIYNADCFDLGDRKIQSYQLAELLLTLFKKMPFWTDQMFFAYDEFNYLFSRQVRKSLQAIRSKEKKRQARTQLTTAQGEVASETATSEGEELEAEATTAPKKKKGTKKQRQLLKKLNPQPKKPRSLTSWVADML